MNRILTILIILITTAFPIYSQSEYMKIAKFHADKGEYDEAIRIDSIAAKSLEYSYGDDSPEYAKCLSDIATYYSRLKEYKEAIRIESGVLEILKNSLGENTYEYITSLNRLAYYYSKFGNNKKAIELAEKVVELRQKVIDKDYIDYADNQISLASYNASVGNYRDAVKVGAGAVETRRKKLGESSNGYAIGLNNLASYYFKLSRYQEAIKLEKQAIEIWEKQNDENQLNYARGLSNLASYYAGIGCYGDAIKYATKATDIRQKRFGDYNNEYISSLHNLASYYYYAGNYKEAIELGSKVAEFRRSKLGDNSKEYALSLSNLAAYNSKLRNNKEAVRLGSMAANILKTVLGEMHPDYALSLQNLAAYNSSLGKLNEAVDLCGNAADIQKEVLGDNNLNYAKSLNLLASYHLKLNNVADAENNNAMAFRIAKRFVLDNLGTMNQLEMENFMSKYGFLLHGLSPSVSYDCELLKKGLTLVAGIEVNRLIKESGNETAIKLLNELTTNLRIRDKQVQKSPFERSMDIDSLSRVIESQQKQLAEMSKEFGDYSKPFQITWTDIRDNLKSGEAAVEFISNDDPARVEALILEPGYIVPKSVKLNISITDMQDVGHDTYVEDISDKDAIAEMMRPLMAMLTEANCVYFAPAGNLHLLPMENILDDGREYIRLTSTREIAINRTNGKHIEKDVDIVAYGGLKYDIDDNELADVNLINESADDTYRSRGLYRSLDDNEGLDRANFNYLPGTLIEVQKIDSLSSQFNTRCQTFTDILGTESSVKLLSGKKYTILHVATHGYFEEFNKANSDNSTTSIYDDSHRVSNEEQALTHTGLLMSGAYAAIMGKENPDNIEDGLLTAKEISRIDLKGCDLAVLSACSSGLGGITGEGVFGLQRGFKKAGVSSILMTLWNVDDDATCLLMTEFYKHLLSGKSKRESLSLAQQTLHNNPKYSDPEYWAAFILLDYVDGC